MVKRCMLLLAVLLLLLPVCASANEQIIDECGLFTAEERVQIGAKIDKIRGTYQMDVAVMTSRSVPYNRSDTSLEQTADFADEYYDRNGYGLGEDRAGILYLLDMKNRVSYISTCGVMIDYVNDRRRESILSAADPYLSRGAYGQAVLALLDRLEGCLAQGIEEGSFRYDEATGQRLTGLYNRLTRSELLVSAGCGLAAGLFFWGAVSMKYNLKRGTYRFNKATQSRTELTRDETFFLRQHVTRTRISSGNGGGGRGFGGGGSGSGVHISSGGGSHGGGGHHF